MLENIINIWSDYWSMFLGQGLAYTLMLSLITVIFGAVIGSLLALMKMSKLWPLRSLATIYIELVRGTPVLLQLYLFYFILPTDIVQAGFGWIYELLVKLNTAMGREMAMNINGYIKFVCIAIALVVNSSAYVSEIIRSGIQAVDRGQTEAARSLGLNGTQCMLRIVLPQAIKNILPALGNEFVMVIKETSLASTFFIGDLMSVYNVVRGKTYLVIEPLIIVGLIYFVLTFVLSKLIAAWERRLRSGD